MRCKRSGKEGLLSFGPYPAVSLADAQDRARAMPRDGRDPGTEKRLRLAAAGGTAGSFEVTARAWHARHVIQWTERHAADVLDSLRRDAFPTLGAMQANDMTPPMVLAVLHSIAARPAIETARRVRQRMSAAFAHLSELQACASPDVREQDRVSAAPGRVSRTSCAARVVRDVLDSHDHRISTRSQECWPFQGGGQARERQTR